MVTFDSYMRGIFRLNDTGANEYSPLALAYIGDSVYDLIIRRITLRLGNRPVNKLHLETSNLVRASAQSRMMRYLQKYLTKEERAVYKRGRNAKAVTPAKNQTITDYRRATGFEALIGYLYLNGEEKRLLDLVKIGLKSMEEGGAD